VDLDRVLSLWRMDGQSVLKAIAARHRCRHHRRQCEKARSFDQILEVLRFSGGQRVEINRRAQRRAHKTTRPLELDTHCASLRV
jgi:hypothetical protein